MTKLIDRIKRMTITEWVFIGAILVLIFLVISNWEGIWKEISESFQILLGLISS